MMIDDNEGENFLPQPDDAAETEQPAETGENGTGEEVLELTEETPEQPERKGKSVQERIDEITAARREAEREAEFWRRKALGTEAPKAEEPTVEPLERPDPSKYEFGEADPAFLEALTDWKVDVRLSQERQRMDTERAAERAAQSYAQNVAAVKEELPNYDEKVTQAAARGEWPCPKPVAELIKSSPVGPKVAYHLATNLDDAQALAGMSKDQQMVAFGMLAAHVSQKTVQPTKIATNAPEPPQARTKGGQFAPSGLDDRQSIDAWVKAREAQLRA